MEDSFSALAFKEAFDIWLKLITPYIQPRTLSDYRQYGGALCEFLGTIKVREIGCRTVQAYQLWRSRDQGDGKPDSYQHGAGHVRIRNEINGVLKPILKEAGRWEEIKKTRFRHLPCSADGAGMLLTKDDQREILEEAFSQRRWLIAAHPIRIMARSGCGFGELRKLRRRDIDLEAGTMTVVIGAKNYRRQRTLRLVPSAVESLRWIVARWERMGGKNPNDYVLPHRSLLRNRHGAFDRPMTTIYHCWNPIKKAWIRRYPAKAHKAKARLADFRPSAATLLMTNPKIAPEMVDKVLGWRPNSRMRKRYNVAEQEMMKEAMNTLEDNPEPPPAI